MRSSAGTWWSARPGRSAWSSRCALGGCGGSTATSTPAATTGPATSGQPSAATSTAAPETPTAGGTIYVLSPAERWNQVDPQRAYTGEDMAFFSATIYRSLTAYKLSADPTEGTSLTPDLATDLGTATDGGKDLGLHPA